MIGKRTDVTRLVHLIESNTHFSLRSPLSDPDSIDLISFLSEDLSAGELPREISEWVDGKPHVLVELKDRYRAYNLVGFRVLMTSNTCIPFPITKAELAVDWLADIMFSSEKPQIGHILRSDIDAPILFGQTATHSLGPGWNRTDLDLADLTRRFPRLVSTIIPLIALTGASLIHGHCASPAVSHDTLKGRGEDD